MGPGEHDLRELSRLLKELGERLDAVEQRLGITRDLRERAAPPTTPIASDIELTQTSPIRPLNAAPIPPVAPRPLPPIIVLSRRSSEEPTHAAVADEPPPSTLVQPPEPASSMLPGVHCEHCDYALKGLEGLSGIVTCPECGGRAQGKWPPRGEPWSLERLIGGRYFLAIGAIVVVIGVGLFLKLGYDMGWFRMSNAWKCIWGAVFGMAMVGGGEVVRRRINVLASTGLSAAGLGALYLSTYAAHGFYSLIGPTVAFIFLALVVALGITIAVVARQAGVAILAMLGGYLAPFLLDIDHPSPTVIPLHSFALLVTGLSLSGWLPSVFRVLRTIAWWGTLILSTIWLAQQGVDHPLIALPFLALTWAVIHAELILSVRGEYESDAPTDESATTLLLRWQNVRPIATSLSTSVWCVFFGVIVLRTTPILPDWFVPAAATAAAALLSMLLAGHLRVLKDSPRTDAQRLGAGLAMQAGAALIAAVALAFSGSLEVCAWLAIGAAAVAAGSWIGAPSLGAYGLVPLSIGAVRLLTWDAFRTRLGFAPLSLGTLVVDRWTLLMIFGAAAWIGAALLLARLRDRARHALPELRTISAKFLRRAPDACMTVGFILLLASFLHRDTAAGAVSIAWMLVAVITACSRVWEQRLNLATYSIAALASATAAWGLAYVTPGWAETSRGSLVHTGTLVALALTIAWAGLAVWYRLDRRNRADVAGPHWIVCAAWATLLAWCFTSLDVHRLVGRIEPGLRDSVGGLAVWWGIFAAGLLIVGFERRVQAVRIAGLAVIALGVGAWVLAFVAPGWRSTAEGAVIHPGFVIAVGFVVALGVLSRRWRAHLAPPDSEIRTTTITLLVAAISLAWLATSLEVFRLVERIEPGARAQGGGLSLWWCTWAVALIVAGFSYRALALRIAGAAVMIFSLGAWLTAFIFPGWTASSQAALIHPGLFISAALTVALAVLARRYRDHLSTGSEEDRIGLISIIVVAILLGWASTSLEAFRLAHHFQSGKYAQHAAVSVWWGLFSIALLAAGFRYRVAPLRYAGLALLASATIKALIIDLSEVSAGWRVVSVLGLGMLMLGVALVYVRTSAKLLGASPPSSSGRGQLSRSESR